MEKILDFFAVESANIIYLDTTLNFDDKHEDNILEDNFSKNFRL